MTDSIAARSDSGILAASEAEIANFESEITRFRQGAWDPNAFIGFRTLQGVYGQRQPDAQMVRVKVPLGILSASQLDTLGMIADQYTSLLRGHVTTREDIQFHFVQLEHTPTIMRLLGEVGLTTREACGNAVRNVTGSPLAGVCPREPFDVTPYAAAYARYFLRHPLTQRLPRKVKSSFSCCDEDDAISDIQDLGFIPRVQAENGASQRGFLVKVGGGTSIFPRTGFVLTEFVSVDDYLRLAEAVLRIFDRTDELRQNRMKARLKFYVQRIGIDAFRAQVDEELRQPWAREPIDLTPLLAGVDDAREERPPVPAARPSSAVTDPAFRRWQAANTRAQRQPGFRAVVVRLPVGTITASGFRGLARIARDFANGQVRTTPQQNLVLRWVREESLPSLYQTLADLGLADVANTIDDATACPGTDSCKSAITASSGLARALAEEFKDIDADDPLAQAIHVKISGCPNGCGQHHLANIGLQGAAVKSGAAQVPCYELYLGGSYTGHPLLGGADRTRLARLAKIRLPAKRVPEAVRRIVRSYQEERQNGEDFNAFVDRVGLVALERLLADLREVPPISPESLDLYRDWERNALFQVERGEGECAV